MRTAAPQGKGHLSSKAITTGRTVESFAQTLWRARCGRECGWESRTLYLTEDNALEAAVEHAKDFHDRAVAVLPDAWSQFEVVELRRKVDILKAQIERLDPSRVGTWGDE